MLNWKKLIYSVCAVLLLKNMLIGGVLAGGADFPGDQPVHVPIVMYHEIKTYKTGKDVILPSEFENDLRYLKENGYTTITIEDLLNYVADEADLPEKPIILSFDDGYLSTYVYAYPLLKEYNMKIVLSIIGKNTDDFTNIPDDDLDYSHVTWDQLNEMMDSGCVEVQNHTYNLHKYGKRIGCGQKKNESYADYEKVLTEDVGKLQDEVLLRTGKTPAAFAYPYGAYNDTTDKILKELGFQATLTCNYGVNVLTRDPDGLFRLKRICRAHNSAIGKLLDEAYETIK